MLTFLVYLNTAWVPGDGGELRIHPRIGKDAAGREATHDGYQAAAEQGGTDTISLHTDVAPLMGRAVAFLSSSIPHEVLPTQVRTCCMPTRMHHTRRPPR